MASMKKKKNIYDDDEEEQEDDEEQEEEEKEEEEKPEEEGEEEGMEWALYDCYCFSGCEPGRLGGVAHGTCSFGHNKWFDMKHTM